MHTIQSGSMWGTGRLIAEMRGGVDEDTAPQDLTNKQVVALHQLLHEAKFKDPDKDHLSPAGSPFLDSVSPSLCSMLSTLGGMSHGTACRQEHSHAPCVDRLLLMSS